MEDKFAMMGESADLESVAYYGDRQAKPITGRKVQRVEGKGELYYIVKGPGRTVHTGDVGDFFAAGQQSGVALVVVLDANLKPALRAEIVARLEAEKKVER